MEEILLESLTPTEEELKELARFARELSMKLSKFGEVAIMGSYAKGTLLRGKKEVDLFVLVEKGTDLHKLVHDMRAALADYETKMAFASHPYLRVRKGTLRADVVPSFKVSSPEELESAVDRTQLHVAYITQHLSEEQKGQVRLLKQFFTNLNVYGAEIKNKGFSGYLCELLVLKFGSFRGVLKYFANFDGKPLYLEGGSNAEFSDPFVFIDPVDPKRNVASPVSRKSLAKAILAARAYLKFPSKEFFFFEGAEEPKNHILSIEFPQPDAVEDMRFGICSRLASKLSSHLSRLGFDVIDYWVFEENSKDVVALEVLEARILSKQVKDGPPLNMPSHISKFISTNDARPTEKGFIAIAEKECSYLLDCARTFLDSYELKLYDKRSAILAEDRSFVFIEREIALNRFILNILKR